LCYSRLEQKDAEYKELDKLREISQEKLALEETVEQTTESQMKENSQQELQKEQNEMQELGDKINDGNDGYEELESKLHEMTVEKQSLQLQLVDSRSEISSLQEKLKEDESLASELKSNYDAKILQITRNFEEEVNALESELKLKKNSEEEALRFRKDVSSLKEENSKLNEELQKHKATISELEETSRSRELEIANLILKSPSPQSLDVEEFDFSADSSDRSQQLENELAKYKKKVQELEEEAEDKFETTLCPNCEDREKSEEILLQSKALVDKIQLDCKKKVQNVSKDLEKTEKALEEQIKEGESLKTKLAKAEDEIREERKRSLEISKLAKTFDVNETSQDIPDTKGNSAGVF
jgi:chromosome segregation ATPase